MKTHTWVVHVVKSQLNMFKVNVMNKTCELKVLTYILKFLTHQLVKNH